MEQKSVLEYIAEGSLLATITVERTTFSKNLFYCLVRHYHQRTPTVPRFFTYAKQVQDALKAELEEHSIFTDGELFVLEGFSKESVDALRVPVGTYVVAETDAGELRVDAFRYQEKKLGVRVLSKQLGLRLPVRELAALDWSGCEGFEEMEQVLRRAKVMEWTVQELDEFLKGGASVELLDGIKRSQFRQLYDLKERYGTQWMVTGLTRVIGQVALLRALRSLASTEERMVKVMSVSKWRLGKLQQMADSVTDTDLVKLAEQLVKLDRLLLRNVDTGLDLLLLNSPIRVTR